MAHSSRMASNLALAVVVLTALLGLANVILIKGDIIGDDHAVIEDREALFGGNQSNTKVASGLEVRNWFGDLQSHPAAIVKASSVDDVVSVVTNKDTYPSPVRPVGSMHSTTPCFMTDGGTILDMSGVDRILEITGTHVTAEAGALYINVSNELKKHGLQFHVNTEIGNLSFGAAAVADMKDSSHPGEYGQVSSYVTAVKMVTPSGDKVEYNQASDAEKMQLIGSSHGLFGVVFEVTIQVKPIRPMSIRHETFKLDEFQKILRETSRREDESQMFYLFPFENKITIEFRRYEDNADGDPQDHVWALRNFAWKTAVPTFAHNMEVTVDNPKIRYKIMDSFLTALRLQLVEVVHGDYTLAPDQTIEYPEIADNSRYTFSIWAFPEEGYYKVLVDYFAFCRGYYRKFGYRANLPNVGYVISQDQTSLLNYAYDGPVITIDPVSTGNDGWHEFILAYNEFAIQNGGKPLFNQAFGLTRGQAKEAFGGRLVRFEENRKMTDPEDRMLNSYFRELLQDKK